MQEVIKYVADDGTEFEDKEVCLSYEKTCLDYERKTLLIDFSDRGLKIFDGNKRELPIENLFYWNKNEGCWKNYKHELATLLELGQDLILSK